MGLLLRRVRVFEHFARLGVGSVKVTLSRPAHQRAMPAVGQFVKNQKETFETLEKIMEAINKPEINEEIAVKRQWVAFIAAFVLFFVAGLISVKVFGVIKYSALGVCLPMLYLGISSIKNRISIARLRGQKGYSTGTRAVVFGILMIVFAIAYIVIIFTPSLSDIFFPF